MVQYNSLTTLETEDIFTPEIIHWFKTGKSNGGSWSGKTKIENSKEIIWVVRKSGYDK